MATPQEIRDAVAADALTGIERVQVGSESVDLQSAEDRLKAAESAAGETAATKDHFGIRMRQIKPPGCG